MTDTNFPLHKLPFDVLYPLRQWIDNIPVKNAKSARFICRLIPCSCPFEMDVVLFDHFLFHIPPLCKLNPLYEQIIALRFRALSFLVDVCHEDVSKYC